MAFSFHPKVWFPGRPPRRRTRGRTSRLRERQDRSRYHRIPPGFGTSSPGPGPPGGRFTLALSTSFGPRYHLDFPDVHRRAEPEAERAAYERPAIDPDLQSPPGLWHVPPRPRPPGGRFTLALGMRKKGLGTSSIVFFIRRIRSKDAGSQSAPDYPDSAGFSP